MTNSVKILLIRGSLSNPEAENTVVAKICGMEIRDYYLVGTEVQWGKRKKFWRWMVVTGAQ